MLDFYETPHSWAIYKLSHKAANSFELILNLVFLTPHLIFQIMVHFKLCYFYNHVTSPINTELENDIFETYEQSQVMWSLLKFIMTWQRFKSIQNHIVMIDLNITI